MQTGDGMIAHKRMSSTATRFSLRPLRLCGKGVIQINAYGDTP
jgi:hypothetical protein